MVCLVYFCIIYFVTKETYTWMNLFNRLSNHNHTVLISGSYFQLPESRESNDKLHCDLSVYRIICPVSKLTEEDFLEANFL